MQAWDVFIWMPAWIWALFWKCFVLPLDFTHHRNVNFNVWVCHTKNRTLWCFGAFLFPNMRPPMSACLSEFCVTFQIAIWDCFLVVSQNVHMMSLIVYRRMPLIVSSFSNKKGFVYCLIMLDKLVVQVMWCAIVWTRYKKAEDTLTACHDSCLKKVLWLQFQLKQTDTICWQESL